MPQRTPNDAELERFLAALRKHESDNRNRPNQGGHSSASGYYQYVNSTWANYGGYRRAMDAPFEVQHQRAREDAIRAWRKHGGDWEKVAAEHFYPGLAGDKSQWHLIPGQERGKAFPGNPTMRRYVSSVMSSMGGVPTTPPTDGGGVSIDAAVTLEDPAPDPEPQGTPTGRLWSHMVSSMSQQIAQGSGSQTEPLLAALRRLGLPVDPEPLPDPISPQPNPTEGAGGTHVAI